MKSVESDLRVEESLWLGKICERGREWTSERVMDGESGELTEEEDVVGAEKGK